MGTPPELARSEQRFRRAGLPLFIEDFSPTHDIFSRAAPLLVLVFIVEMLGATSLEWPLWVNLLAALGGLAVLIGGFGLLNRFRRRRGQLRQFFGVAAGNLLLVGLVYVVVGYGLIGTTFWGSTGSAPNWLAPWPVCSARSRCCSCSRSCCS